MLYHPISRLFLYVCFIMQLPWATLVAQPKPVQGGPAVSVARQAQAGGNNEPRVASQQESKKAEENPGLWSNPLVKATAVVAFIYAGGIVVAGAIWYRIKDLFPVDTAKRNDNDDEDDGDE